MARHTNKQSKSAYDPRLEAIEKEISRRVEVEYRSDIVEHLKEMDKTTTANASMIEMQPELEWYMRPHLLDFLVDSHAAFGLKPETLFLAVNLIDRYCSVRVVYKKHYQLVGCTGLWIAAKYMDKSRTPSLRDLVSICCNAYEEEMFVQMELHILNTLEWVVGHSTVETFLSMVVGNYADTTVAYVARYLCEISMYSQSFIGMSTSVIAQSCFTLAMIISEQYPTIPSNISSQEIQCMSMLSQQIAQPSKVLYKKYSHNRTGQAASLVAEYLQRQEQPPHASTTSSNSSVPVALPPTPPSSSISKASPKFSTPQHCSIPKNDLHIQVPGFNHRQNNEGFVTPPCTPEEQEQQMLQQRNQPVTAFPTAPPPPPAFHSVPMETTRFF